MVYLIAFAAPIPLDAVSALGALGALSIHSMAYVIDFSGTARDHRRSRSNPDGHGAAWRGGEIASPVAQEQRHIVAPMIYHQEIRIEVVV